MYRLSGISTRCSGIGGVLALLLPAGTVEALGCVDGIAPHPVRRNSTRRAGDAIESFGRVRSQGSWLVMFGSPVVAFLQVAFGLSALNIC
jgi:hypothetical protein